VRIPPALDEVPHPAARVDVRGIGEVDGSWHRDRLQREEQKQRKAEEGYDAARQCAGPSVIQPVYGGMPLAALALLLAAACMHATWNFFAKGARNDTALQFASAALAVVAYLPIVAVVIIVGDPSIGWTALGFVAVSSVLHYVYFLLLGEGYRRGDLSLVYPLARGTGPALAVVGAIILFDERPGWLALAGGAMIIAGILLMSWSSELRGQGDAGIAIAFALATGGIIAVYTLWDKQGVDRMAPLLYGYGLEAGRLALVAPHTLGRAEGRRQLRETLGDQRRAILAIGLLSPGAYMMVLAALSLAPVSYVAPARELSILIGAVLGLRLLGESHPVRRMSGAAMIVLGIVALALG
jgi:drug/metabolite transporter (DMT)-like permease